MPRILRRFVILVVAALLPLYAISFTEDLEVPDAWHRIKVGDNHAQVRARLRESGLADRQCEWHRADSTVRCTLIGRHHASGVAIRFTDPGTTARVAAVTVREPIYTGPFHLHSRIRRALR